MAKGTLVVNPALFSMKHFDAERDLPLVYNPTYNIYFVGMEIFHQFDTKKYSKIASYLNESFLDTPFARFRRPDEPFAGPESDDNRKRRRKLWFLTPNRPVNMSELMLFHKPTYLRSIFEDKATIARITELWSLNLVTQNMIYNRLIEPILWQTAGTIFAAHLAMQHGWAVNIGGGFHMASSDRGETFCMISDIGLSMAYIWRKHPAQKFMIIDLDAHQALGIERDLVKMDPKHRKLVYMLDVYNESIQPPDQKAQIGIDLGVSLGRFTGDETYFKRLECSLAKAFESFRPTLIFYVAGQDILKNDHLGLMNVSDQAYLRRDELVFRWAVEKNRSPIVMLLGGGYQQRGIKLFSDSIRNLYTKGLIWGGHRSGQRTLTRPLQAKPGDTITENSHHSGTDSAKKMVHLWSRKTSVVKNVETLKVAKKKSPVVKSNFNNSKSDSFVKKQAHKGKGS